MCEMQLAELREYVARRGINEQDEEVAHSGNSISTSRTTAFRSIWQFAMDTLDCQSSQTAHSQAHNHRSAGVSLGRWTERCKPS